MKKHAIIPIFISHRGCPNDCVFCNQKKITARSGDVTPDDARKTIEEHLSTLEHMNLEKIEVAFFGGSFTGIPLEEQTAFLKIAKEYKDAGRIDAIHLSTRPDYISEDILNNLKKYNVDVIELGVQSLAPDVLELSERGHTAEIVPKSAALIKDYGFTLGIQLMIGLPGDTLQKCIFSAKETVKMQPEIARLYPTVVISGTKLHDMYLCGEYIPPDEEEMINRTKAMYEILDNAGINIIRVGLKSSDIMADQTAFHPAFRQLVEGRIARERLESQLEKLYPGMHGFAAEATEVTEVTEETVAEAIAETTNDIRKSNYKLCPIVTFVSNSRCYNNMFGHKGCNREYFKNKYPRINIDYSTDTAEGLTLADNQYMVIDRGHSWR